MNTKSMSVGFAAGLTAILFMSGCARRDEATVGTPANPLVVVLSPAYSPAAAPDAEKTLREHLEKASGLTVQLRVAPSQMEAINAFSSGKTDAALLRLEEYLVARQEYGVSPGLQALREGKASDYEAVILGRDGKAQEIGALKDGKIGLVGPYSVSGFTLPSIYLKKAGGKFTPVFSKSHDENVERLLKGEFDAAATYARYAAKRKGLKVLAVTGRVPNEPVAVRRGLDAAKREKILAAFSTLADKPEGRKVLAAMADITGFRPVDASVYKPIHDLIRSEGKAVYDLVPDGWTIHKLNQPYFHD
ncbi:MAG: phosphate/phosphite/phosphonate ABC transporter substrate-binding protein [Elusimicrobiales bacterium]|jgi:phosphate/phosphite/phosphonate ABC transporter binding protein|nr:phosphate/phosphite/phosphonate ABC transporter substrate-binding protein [Elusimicrobiales bacterium]